MIAGNGGDEPMGFDAFEAKMLTAGLPRVAIDTFHHYYDELVSGATGLIPEDTIEPVASLPSSEDLDSGDVDRDAVDRAVVLKLNGGLGTSMGMTRAKSLLDVKDGLTFLDVIARQMLALRERFDARLPLVLMDSFRTQDDSLAVLRRYPDLASDLPEDFVQNKVPKVLVDGLGPASWPADPDLEWCPPGHGDLYTAIQTSGMLGRLLDRGYRYAFVSNSDNLGAVLDPAILTWLAREEVPFLMEAADRTAADRKGGHLAVRPDGRLILRELAQCPAGDQNAFQDVARYRYFNTNNLWVDLVALSEALHAGGGVLGLPMIRNTKTLDPAAPSSPAVYQLETAMGAAIAVFEGARAIRVPRARLAPVKTTNDLLVVRSDAYRLTDTCEMVRVAGDMVVDLDPAFYKLVDRFDLRFPSGPPSLAACRRLVVRGDVRFGGGVVVRGDVTLDGPAEIAPGAVLDATSPFSKSEVAQKRNDRA